MIIAFVIDTSPSMGTRCEDSKTMSRLDLAKMTVESLTKMLEKRMQDHNLKVHLESLNIDKTATMTQKQLQNLGFGYCPHDQFILLATGRQHSTNDSSTESCGAGGRLLVGFNSIDHNSIDDFQPHELQTCSEGYSSIMYPQYKQNHECFERELKQLEVTQCATASCRRQKADKSTTKPNQLYPFPEDGGGSAGLNIALSTGLQLLSRYRLQNRCTENFGMGRLPANSVLAPPYTTNDTSSTLSTSSTSLNGNHIQSACLILLTDGECLHKCPSEGGGSLQLQVSMPLREFYREPFRWDQRIFCLGIGKYPTSNSTANDSSGKNNRPLHPALNALCEVTGGQHIYVRSHEHIPNITERLLRMIAPPLPSQFPLSFNCLPGAIDRLGFEPPTCGFQKRNCLLGTNRIKGGETRFVNGGPVCCFQQLEATNGGGVQIIPTLHRAMLLYSPHLIDVTNGKSIITSSNTCNQPIWCIPEAFFPSKTLEQYPPRNSQPILHFSKHYQMIGGFNFNPLSVIKCLNRLDQLVVCNRQLFNNSCGSTNKIISAPKLLQRDVYICDWQFQPQASMVIDKKGEHLPVFVRNAGRNSLHEGGENVLNIGILYVPAVASKDSTKEISTLTLLPPDPHILIPLLLKVAEIEHRGLKKASQNQKTTDMAKAMNMSRNNLLVDEHWRSEFCAYLYRIPPYYQVSLRRTLRSILPTNLHSLLNVDSFEVIKSQCISRQIQSKIMIGEQFAKENRETLDRQEEDYRKYITQKKHQTNSPPTGYGQEMDTNAYLASLRTMSRPSRIKCFSAKSTTEDLREEQYTTSKVGNTKEQLSNSFFDCVEKLPSKCLLAFYESRRRWLFGGSGLSIRGLAVEGVKNDGTTRHCYDQDHDSTHDALLACCGVGASMLNRAPINKMGDFRTALSWSPISIAGYGCNDSNVSAMTTGVDGSPVWSVDDDALPLSFFDCKTGEFIDSPQTRLRNKLNINFGNPYKDIKRGDTLCPQKYMKQRPTLQQRKANHEESCRPLPPPGSPPHEAYSSTGEGEDEAVFAGRNKQLSSKKCENSKTEENRTEDEIESKSASQTHIASRKRKSNDDSFKGHSTLNFHSMKKSKLDGDKKNKMTPLSPTSGSKEQPKQSKGKQTHSIRPPPPPPPPKQKPPPPPPPTRSQIQPHTSHKTDRRNQQNSLSQKSAQDLQTPDMKPKVSLPTGWISVWSKSKQRWYFFDTKTNKSVWEWPP